MKQATALIEIATAGSPSAKGELIFERQCADLSGWQRQQHVLRQCSSPLKTFGRNLAPSGCSIHKPGTSLRPCSQFSTRTCTCTSGFRYTAGTIDNAPNHCMNADISPLTTQQAASRLGVTVRTLKYYEAQGLVTPKRSKGHYRLYSESDLVQFARILRLKSLGFSLRTISEMLKRPLDQSSEDGRARYSLAALRDIHTSLSGQLQILDERVANARRELAEVNKMRERNSFWIWNMWKAALLEATQMNFWLPGRRNPAKGPAPFRARGRKTGARKNEAIFHPLFSRGNCIASTGALQPPARARRGRAGRHKSGATGNG